jgi:cysteine-rich repeat protein
MEAMRQIHALLLGLLMVGCVQSQAIPCGDILCPSGAVCTETGQCAFASDIAACVGKADGEACEARGGNIGVCSAGTCSVGQCGNSIVDGGESCDDGNRVGADGCAADCSKREICGDAIADDGEACDDGNRNAVDGCDACKLTQWSAAAVVGAPVPGIASGLGNPGGIAIDVRGNLYIADTANHRIRRVTSNGSISTVAGTGTAGYNGNRMATSAQLAGPTGVAVDGLGNVYIADSGNNMIRRVDRNGMLSTVAGTGDRGYNGDGLAATSATLSDPWDVAVDGLGNMYIADRDNHRVRRVDNHGMISTVAGTGTRGYNGDGLAATSQLAVPHGVTLDRLGNLYIADSGNSRIRRVDSSGMISTVAGTGTRGYNGDGLAATSAHLVFPSSVAVDGLGNVYIADSASHRIRRVDTLGVISTIAGTGTRGYNGDGTAAISAQLDYPTGVLVDPTGDVYIADNYNYRIRRVDSNSGNISTVAGTGSRNYNGDGLPATTAQLVAPSCVAIDGMGNVYIADSRDHRIRRVDNNGIISTVAGTGSSGYHGDGVAGTGAPLSYPFCVAVDDLGNVYIADTDANRIRRVDSNGIISTVAGNGTRGYSGDGMAATNAQLADPIGVAVDGHGNLYIADITNHRIRRVGSNGTISTVAGTGIGGYNGDRLAATSAQLSDPWGVTVDGRGNVYIADRGNHRVRRVDVNGIISTVAGTGTAGYNGDGMSATSSQLDSPDGVAVDGVGNVYIADSANHRIRRVDSNGEISTVVGTGTRGFDGDGGPARSSMLADPASVSVDGLGNLYTADNNNRLRRVDSDSGIITSFAGGEQLGGTANTIRVENVVALVKTDLGALFLGTGTNGIAARIFNSKTEPVAGRYPHSSATGNLARFRDRNFGSVGGVAWDESAQLLYLTESSATSSKVWAVTPIDPNSPDTWTIAALVNDSGTAGFADGASTTAKLRNPTGLWLDEASRTLYIADTGNHAIRALDLNAKTVTTVVNAKHSLGFAGDGAAATAALLYQPQALTKCANGDLFIADTGNNRIRRVAAGTGLISTVVGDGVPASSGQGAPATIFPVDSPLGVACDAANNLFISSSTTVRLLPASTAGIVDGSGDVQTIYGAAPRNAFPASETSCLTGIIAPTATTLQVADSCSGLVVELTRTVAP